MRILWDSRFFRSIPSDDVSPLSVFARSLQQSNPVTSFANDGDQRVGSGTGGWIASQGLAKTDGERGLDCYVPQTGLAKTKRRFAETDKNGNLDCHGYEYTIPKT